MAGLHVQLVDALARQIVLDGSEFGTGHSLAGRHINVEFISANPTGPLHLGHTRWAAVGDALARVLAAAGADVARELYAACAERGVGFLDAPVSGGQAGAQNGVLTVMCGGDRNTFDLARPVIMSFARACELLGSAGSGQLAKMVNQICIAGIVQGLAEGVNFAQKAGLDVAQLISVISKGAAQSWQMENRYSTMAEGKFEFGFAVEWMRKDLGIVLDEAQRNGARLPLTALVDQFYAQVIARGGRRWDTSSLIDLLQRP